MGMYINDSLGFILNKTNTKLKHELLQRFKEYDVTPEQWAILNCLWEKDGITPKELSDSIVKDKPNTNRILEKLQMKELIVRKPHPIDKRAFQVFLTDKGRALQDQLIPRAKELLVKVTAGIEEHKITELKYILNQIYSNIK